jgi:hypothetical protein
MTGAPQPDPAAALRALAAEVEAIQRRLPLIQGLAETAQESANAAHRGLAQLADAIPGAALAGDEPADEETVEPWLVLEDPDVARTELADLADWLGAVYLRYHRSDLGACWMWHPTVVAELLALRDGWRAAYYGPRATATAALDWHDRYRPATVSRIRAELNDCSLTEHASRGRRQYAPVRLRGADLADEMATWWATTHGGTAAPAPTPTMLAQERTDLHDASAS